MTNRGALFEKSRREYWNNRSDTIDVFRDTHGPTDLAVVFKRDALRESKVLLIQAKLNGLLGTDRQKLERFLEHKPVTVELRIEFLKDLNKSCGHRNTTYTVIKAVEHLDYHAEKVERLRGKQ